MGKYEPLADFLRKQRNDQIALTFGEIERIVGFKLPLSAKEHRAWWSNNPSNSVMTKAWLSAGFESEQVDMENRKLVFRRVKWPRSPAGGALPPHDTDSDKPHLLVGWLKGIVHIAPGVDLTEPADPEWGKRAWGHES
jgi:hypothetical protein